MITGGLLRCEPCDGTVCHDGQSGFAEGCLHPRQSPDKAGSADALRLGHVQAKERLGMAFAPSGLWLCARFALFFETRARSRTAVQAGRGWQIHPYSAEAEPALAAKLRQYAPSFSLSVPCISPSRRTARETGTLGDSLGFGSARIVSGFRID